MSRKKKIQQNRSFTIALWKPTVEKIPDRKEEPRRN
jgi:hypothetical protein